MLGLPGETKDQSEATVQFAVNSKLDYALFYQTEPYPGTEMWKDAVENGYFISDGEHKNFLLTNFDKVWVPDGRTREELIEIQDRAYRTFYLRLRIILGWLSNWPRLGLRRLWRGVLGGLQIVVISQVPFFKKNYKTDTKR